MTQEKVLAYITDHPDATIKEIADACGIVASNAVYHIDKLIIAGKLINIPPQKRWRLPEEEKKN